MAVRRDPTLGGHRAALSYGMETHTTAVLLCQWTLELAQ
jgi:hypothetical protein